MNLAAWVVPILGGMLIGAINGFFVAYLGIPAIVVTLGMFSILKGGLILVAAARRCTILVWLRIRHGEPVRYPAAESADDRVLDDSWHSLDAYNRTGRSQYAVGGMPKRRACRASTRGAS